MLRTGASRSRGSSPRIGPQDLRHQDRAPSPSPGPGSRWSRRPRGGSARPGAARDGQRAQVLERGPEQRRVVDAPALDLAGGDVGEGRPEVDAEAGPDAGRHENVHRGRLRRVRVVDAPQDRQDERRDVGPRRVEVQALGRRKDAVEQLAIHRAAKHPHRDLVVAPPAVLGLAVAPPLRLRCPAVAVALRGFHAGHGGDGRSPARIADFTGAYQPTRVRYASDCPRRTPWSNDRSPARSTGGSASSRSSTARRR